MEFNGDVLTIDSDMSMEEIIEFEEFIRSRVDYVETIEVNEDGTLQSSALIALLVSLKKTSPNLKIPFLEKGKFVSKSHGTMNWICYD